MLYVYDVNMVKTLIPSEHTFHARRERVTNTFIVQLTDSFKIAIYWR